MQSLFHTLYETARLVASTFWGLLLLLLMLLLGAFVLAVGVAFAFAVVTL